MQQALEFALSLTRPHDEAELCDWLLDTLRDHWRPSGALLGLVDISGRQFTCEGWIHGKPVSLTLDVDDFSHPLAYVLHKNQVRTWDSLYGGARVEHAAFRGLLAEAGAQCGLHALPVNGENGKSVGVLALFDSGVRLREWHEQNELPLLARIFTHQLTLLRDLGRSRREQTVLRDSLRQIKGKDAQLRQQEQLLEASLIGQSAAIRRLHQQIGQAAQHHLAVLIQGETGAGKDVVARLLHQCSVRADKPFIAINCAAIPENLIESELFGYQKGAFSGAQSNKDGLVAQANGGTLFLDEVGDMPMIMGVLAALLVIGWHHYYRLNEEAGRNVLNKAQAFTDTTELAGQQNQGFGYGQLPRLNLIREATLSFGDYREKTPVLSEMGLYQGDKIGPFVEGTYLQLLSQRFLPAVMQGLQDDLNQAPKGSEQKLAILRIMRMIDDASGRNKSVVEQYMGQRWQRAFPGQGKVQEHLMQHLDYALEHTDWHQARQQKDAQAIAAFEPFRTPIADAQRELSKLPMFQRIYQSLVTKSLDVLPPDMMMRDEVGPVFDTVFALRNDKAGTVPRLLTNAGFSEYFVKQDKTLFDLAALDAWVLGQREKVYLSEEDRREIQRQVNDRYITDYVNQWQKVLAGLDVQPLETPEQALDVLTAITGNDQPFQRVIAALNDNTRARKLSDNDNDPAQLMNARISRTFMTTNSTLSGRGDQVALIQEVNQKLTEFYHSLEQIVNAGDPGQAALKAMQLRQTNRFADPAFALQQYARSLPTPLDRWVGQIAEQSSHLVMDLAMSSLNQEWQDKVVTPFNDQLADRYPFNPESDKDVALSEMERFFAPGGTLDSFYQANLKSILNEGQGSGDVNTTLQTELVKQLDRADRIRKTLFNAQGGLEVHFVLEPIELTANKRRSVLNLDGQLLEYSHGRRQKTPLVWPNNMRDGAESKITLVPDNRERSPRSLGYIGPWAMFRLINTGELRQVNENTFDVQFAVDQGSMSYRVYTDASHNPFAGGLFSQFQLPESLY